MPPQFDDDDGWEYLSITFPREHDADTFAEKARERFSFASFAPDYDTVLVRYFEARWPPTQLAELRQLAEEHGTAADRPRGRY